MKDKIIGLYNKYPKYFKIGGIVLGVLLLGFLSWKLVFVKYKEFHDNESKFTKAAKRYYEYHKQALPKKGESRELTLQDLYDMDLVEDLFVPSSRKLCDVDNSWVRVYIDEKDEYKYYTYLKCGRYQSRVDHEGPEITLKGDTDITVALGSEYTELGVKSAVDKKDGKIDVKNVVISSNINMHQIGEYKVTYTAKDSHYNKTVVTRNVTVAKGLTDTVRSTANGDGYYKGHSNNYVLFSGMLWNIVHVNEDGSVKLILNQPLANLRANYNTYKDSNIDKWLNNVFYKAIASNKYIVKKDYCIGKINSMNDINGYCDDLISTKVGLLDVYEYRNTFNGDDSSINSRSFMLSHKIGDNYADATFDTTTPDGTLPSILAPIRPVITVNDKLSILAGDGTYAKPYKLNDYSYANKKDKINTRIVGEYVEYSGLVFRIIGIDKNNNVRLILNGEWEVAPNNTALYISTDNLDKWEFNLDDEKNPAYIINNDYLDYLNTKDVVTTEYDIPINDADKMYDEYKTEKVKAKLVLPKTYDLFSNVGTAEYLYTYLDRSTNDQMLFMANTANGKVFELGKTDFNSYSIKFVTTIKGDMLIESGKGTLGNPYKLK